MTLTEKQYLSGDVHRTTIFIFADRGGQSRSTKKTTAVVRDKYYFATRLAP